MRSSQLYYLYVGLSSFGMATTFTSYAPFLQSIGLSLGQISLLNALFWTTLIVMELPTGMFADGKSRAWSMKIGLLFQMAGSVSYFFAQGFFSALIGEGFIGIGMAFISGADKAWITDALTREGRDHERRHVFATANIVRGLTVIIGGYVGSLIALSHIRFIWTPMIPTALIAAWIAHAKMNGTGEPVHRITEREALCASVNLLRRQKSLQWVIACIIAIGTVISFNHFWSPYFKPIVGTFGLAHVWALMYLGVGVSGYLIRRSATALGNESIMIVFAMFVTACGMFIAGWIPGLAFPLIGVIVHESGRGMFDPLVDSFVQHRVESSYRATFGSLQSLIGRLGYAIIPIFIWATIRNDPNTPDTIQFVWLACAIALAVCTFILFLVRPQST